MGCRYGGGAALCKQEQQWADVCGGQIRGPADYSAHDQVISKGLYINPALLVWAEAGASRIPPELAGLAPHPYSFLTEFHMKYVLKAGDMVVVLQVGAGFYIMEKVVKVA